VKTLWGPQRCAFNCECNAQKKKMGKGEGGTMRGTQRDDTLSDQPTFLWRVREKNRKHPSIRSDRGRERAIQKSCDFPSSYAGRVRNRLASDRQRTKHGVGEKQGTGCWGEKEGGRGREERPKPRHLPGRNGRFCLLRRGGD